MVGIVYCTVLLRVVVYICALLAKVAVNVGRKEGKRREREKRVIEIFRSLQGDVVCRNFGAPLSLFFVPVYFNPVQRTVYCKLGDRGESSMLTIDAAFSIRATSGNRCESRRILACFDFLLLFIVQEGLQFTVVYCRHLAHPL